VHLGKANARTLTRARILLKSAEGWSAAELAEAFDVCEAPVTNVRGRFARGGLEAVLHDKVQQHRRSALSGLLTAHLMAMAAHSRPLFSKRNYLFCHFLFLRRTEPRKLSLREMIEIIS
jgi:transposase